MVFHWFSWTFHKIADKLLTRTYHTVFYFRLSEADVLWSSDPLYASVRAGEWRHLGQSSGLRCLFVLGWFARPADTQHEKPTRDFLREFLEEIRAGNIKQYLRYTQIHARDFPIRTLATVDHLACFCPNRKFTHLPHLAGTEQNLRLAEQIRKEWLAFGLDSAELVWYDVLLSYPNATRPNYISIVDQHGDEVHPAQYNTPSS